MLGVDRVVALLVLVMHVDVRRRDIGVPGRVPRGDNNLLGQVGARGVTQPMRRRAFEMEGRRFVRWPQGANSRRGAGQDVLALLFGCWIDPEQSESLRADEG